MEFRTKKQKVIKDASRARIELAKLMSRAAYGKERVVLTRHGQELAALVPIVDYYQLELWEGHLDVVGAGPSEVLLALLQRMLDKSAELVQARACAVLLWDRENNQLTTQMPFLHLEEARGVSLSVPIEASPLASLLTDDGPIVIDAGTALEPDRALLRSLEGQTLLGMPLVTTDKERLGVCCAIDKQDGQPFGPEDTDILDGMARQLAAVIAHCRARASSESILSS